MDYQNYLMVGVVVFVLAISLFILHFIMTTIFGAMISNPVIAENNQTVQALQNTENLKVRFDMIIFTLFITLTIVSIIVAWMVGGNPIMMAIFFILTVISIIVAAFLSNTWETISQLSVWGTTLASFPIANNIILYLPYYIAVVGFINMVLMFSKTSMNQ